METHIEADKPYENTPLESDLLVQPTEPLTTDNNDSKNEETIETINGSGDGEFPAGKSDSTDDPAQELKVNDGTEDEDFVIVQDSKGLDFEPHRATFFVQMESYLLQQIDKLNYYREIFDQQSNTTMANRLATHSISSQKHLELLRLCWKNNDLLPKHKFEVLCFNCLPVNIEMKEKEIQISVRLSNLKLPLNSFTYIIAEFEFPHPKDESLTNYLSRWIHYARIDYKNLFCCSGGDSRQLDIVHSTDTVLFNEPENKVVTFDRSLRFFVDKGKSRTLKRKFKPIKLTFFEKSGICSCDKRLGCILVKIDAINDESSIITRLPIMNGRKQTDAIAEVRVKVREPLVNKSIRSHEEQLLVLV